MRFALFKYGFKAGFRDVTDKQLQKAAFAGALIGCAVTLIVFTTKAGL